MQKLVLGSILAVTILLPALAARYRDPRRALLRALLWTLIGIGVYEGLVLFVYPRLLG